MKQRSSSTTSRTNRKKLAGMRDKDIVFTRTHPEADVRHVVRGIVRRGLQPVSSKASISLRLDTDVLNGSRPRARVTRRE
jgi:uncharacterized protein (DUF4415 family)